MTKTQKPNDEEKIVKENIEKRFKNMFTGENEPLSNMSLKEAEALKARVVELEKQLGDQPPATPEPKPIRPLVQLPSAKPVEKHPAAPRQETTLSGRQKLVGLWVAAIFAA